VIPKERFPSFLRNTGVQIKSTPIEKNRFAIMILVSKATGYLFDGLYLVVQPFSHGIGDPMFEVDHNIRKVAFQGFRCLNHGLQPTVGSPKNTSA
jgi:hypothetical protein